MNISYRDNFTKNLKDFSLEIKKKVKKQINYLSKNIRHPSLRAKKYNENQGIWQARVDKNIRFYFKIEDDTYILTDIINHPK